MRTLEGPSIGQPAASAVAGRLWILTSPRVAFLNLVGWGVVALVQFARVTPTRAAPAPA